MDTEYFSSVDRDKLRQQIVQRLQDEQNIHSLADLIIEYYVDTREIATLAETLAEGMRFDGLANEVYACFQHVARGLAEASVDTREEFSKARNSHLKRLRLDGHKIVINRALSEAKPILDAVDYLSSNSEIIRLLPQGEDTIKRVRELRKDVRKKYLEAKRAEGKGSGETVNYYCDAVTCAIELLGEVEHFAGTQEVLFALKREQEKRLAARESINVSKKAFWVSGFSFLIAAIALGWGIYRDITDEPTTGDEQPPAQVEPASINE